MAGKQTRGRQRIPISRIHNQDDMYATFSKRRLGLYKKASELSTLCGVDIGVIIFSPTNNPYSFFHPNMESVVNRYTNPNQPQDAYSRVVESTTRSRIHALNTRLDRILEDKQALTEQSRNLDEIEQTRQKGWWEETPIESLNREQVKERIHLFQAFKAQVESRIEQLQNGASTSAPNPENFTHVAGPSTQVGPHIFTPSHYYGIPDLAQDPSSYANEVSHLYSQYFLPQDASSFYNSVSQAAAGSDHIPTYFSSMSSHEAMDSGSEQVLSHYMYPQPPQDPSGGGSDQVFTQFFNSSSSLDHGHTPSQFFLPAVPPLTSSMGGIGNDPISGRYGHIHPHTRDPSTVGASGMPSSADQERKGNN
ncbi:hypothetical protein ACS0TY_012023 [Phlomoides rotata]